LLLSKIEELKKSQISKLIVSRIKEFKTKKPSDEIFSELCFCLMTANFNAERSIKIQEQIGSKEFLTLSKEKLSVKLKRLGHRFYNKRAEFICLARKSYLALIKLLKTEKDEYKIRDWLVKNIKGLGFKESSHFLRNIGFENVAIIDFHIVDLLVKEGLVGKMKSRTLAKKTYLEIEQTLQDIGRRTKLNLAELDLYLWYLETGKILK